MKKVLIFGVSSFIGSSLATYLRRHYRVYGTYASEPPRIDHVATFRLPLSFSSPFSEVLNLLKPQAVVYCPAIVSAPRNQEESQQALFVNAEAPTFLARMTDQRGGRFVYLSSSKVFSGEKGNYEESDPTDPVGVYGKTKARAEELLRELKSTFILRLGTIFGVSTRKRPCPFDRLLADLRAKKEVPYIADEYRSFYSVLDVAKAVGITLDASLEHAGLYHLSQPEKHTYYSFAKRVAHSFGLPSDQLVPVAGSAFRSELSEKAGARGHDLSLAAGRFEETFSSPLPDLENSLQTLKQLLEKGGQ